MSSIRAIRPGRMTRNRGRVAAECALLADRAECPLLLALATIAHQKLAIVCALQIESEITRGLTEWLPTFSCLSGHGSSRCPSHPHIDRCHAADYRGRVTWRTGIDPQLHGRAGVVASHPLPSQSRRSTSRLRIATGLYRDVKQSRGFRRSGWLR